MRKLIFAGVCLVLAGCTTTEEPASGTVATERLNTEQLRTLLTGKNVAYSAGGRAVFALDGVYTFRGSSGISTGQYFFQNDRVCYDFGGGNQRCDSFIRIGNAYYLVNNRGRRFRARISG